jgi:hypothetical protein
VKLGWLPVVPIVLVMSCSSGNSLQRAFFYWNDYGLFAFSPDNKPEPVNARCKRKEARGSPSTQTSKTLPKEYWNHKIESADRWETMWRPPCYVINSIESVFHDLFLLSLNIYCVKFKINFPFLGLAQVTFCFLKSKFLCLIFWGIAQPWKENKYRHMLQHEWTWEHYAK